MVADKRYQIFISSTFRDLVHERQGVLKSILEMEHMPAGMELFAAGDDSAWDLIKDVIDDSDYYVLIVGGRYGSLDEGGIGFTEKEYLYALETKKPVIPLLHANPNNLPRERTESDAASWEKLQAFRAKVEKKHTCVYWSTPDELKARVVTSLMSTTKRHPAIGWVRADKLPSEDVLSELLMLRRRISELESDSKEGGSLAPPKGTEGLSQGGDAFSVPVEYSVFGDGDIYKRAGTRLEREISVTWDDIFSTIAPSMIDDVSNPSLRGKIRQFFWEETRDLVSLDLKSGEFIDSFEVSQEDIDTCVIQLRALGLIRESDRQRSVKDTQSYWRLTTYGDLRMTQLRALRRPQGGSV
ncbi:DUF4062 domain-containing protein [Myxococcus sp. CA056]|nr:DUF4062 domain-containing protein [Myxococcus sp. CA056]